MPTVILNGIKVFFRKAVVKIPILGTGYERWTSDLLILSLPVASSCDFQMPYCDEKARVL